MRQFVFNKKNVSKKVFYKQKKTVKTPIFGVTLKLLTDLYISLFDQQVKTRYNTTTKIQKTPFLLASFYRFLLRPLSKSLKRQCVDHLYTIHPRRKTKKF